MERFARSVWIIWIVKSPVDNSCLTEIDVYVLDRADYNTLYDFTELDEGLKKRIMKVEIKN